MLNTVMDVSRRRRREECINLQEDRQARLKLDTLGLEQHPAYLICSGLIARNGKPQPICVRNDTEGSPWCVKRERARDAIGWLLAEPQASITLTASTPPVTSDLAAAVAYWL